MREGVRPSVADPDSISTDLAVFERTEGWAKLTDRQRQLIRLSLFVSSRDKQHRINITAAHKLRVEGTTYKEGDRVVTPEELEGRYRASYDHINMMFCNGAVAVLEENLPLKVSPSPSKIPGFFDAPISEPKTYSELEALISNHGFPCVVHMLSPNNFHGDKIVASAHSCVVLGEVDGEFVIWEKTQQGFGYRRSTLREVTNDYPPQEHKWAVRPLKIPRNI